jgi:nucleoside-triphosphatase THEP1
MITNTTYLQEVKRIGIDNLPEALKSSYNFFGKATNDYHDFHRVEAAGKIKEVWELYLEKLNKYSISLKEEQPEPEKVKELPAKIVKASPKPQREPSANKQAKPKSAPKVKATPEPEKEHLYVEDIPIEVKFIKSYISMNGRQKTRTQLLGFLARLQKAIREHKIRGNSMFASEINHIQKEVVAVINSLKNESPFAFELDKADEKALRTDWRQQFTDKYRQKIAVSIIKRYINIQGKGEAVRSKAETLLKFIDGFKKRSKNSISEYSNELQTIYDSLSRFINHKENSIKIHEQVLNGLHEISGIKKKSALLEKDCSCIPPALGFIPELASTVVASLIYDQVSTNPGKSNTPASANSSISSSSSVIRSEQLKNMKFSPIGLTGEWKDLLGDVTKPFALMVYGKPGSGKSTFNLLFAKYLAQELNKKVLIVSGEEGFSATMKEKFERLNVYHPIIFITDELPESFNGYDVVFIDSVNHLQLSEEDLKKILENNLPKGISFVFVFHSTKEGNYRGVTTFEHLVDISMKVEGGITSIGKNRFGGHGSMKVY